MRPHELSSWLAPHLEHHLALKRACGFEYRAQAGVLGRFDRYLVKQRAPFSPSSAKAPSPAPTSSAGSSASANEHVM